MRNHYLPLYFTIFIFHFSFSQTWEPVGAGIPGRNTQHPPVNALCVYHNKLYAAGNFTMAGNKQTNSIACWNGKKWDTVGSGVEGVVYSLCPYKNELCIAGNFSKILPNKIRIRNKVLWQDSVGWFRGLGSNYFDIK